MNKKWQHGFWVGLFVVLLVLMLSISVTFTYAQGPTPTPDVIATLEVLQEKLITQETQIIALQAELDLSNRQMQLRLDQDDHERNVKIWDMLQPWIIGFGLIGGIALVLGSTATHRFKKTHEYIKEQAKELKQRADDLYGQALDGANPRYMLIHIPDDGFDAEREYLKVLGFSNLRTYNPMNLDSSKLNRGIVVFPARNDEELKPLIALANNEQLDLRLVAFLVYTAPERYVNSISMLQEAFENAVAANFKASLVTQIYALARMLNTPTNHLPPHHARAGLDTHPTIEPK